ncbi:hypothetical protein [Hydrogenophaga atypica]
MSLNASQRRPTGSAWWHRVWLACALLLWMPWALADNPQPTGAHAPHHVLQVFVRDGCPHCAAAKAFLPQ